MGTRLAAPEYLGPIGWGPLLLPLYGWPIGDDFSPSQLPLKELWKTLFFPIARTCTHTQRARESDTDLSSLNFPVFFVEESRGICRR